MKLASALTERSDLQRRIAELSKRLNHNAKVQEGDTPAEDPKMLLAEINECTDKLESLISKINLANSTAHSGNMTMTEMLAKRDCLKQKLRIYRSFLDYASDKIDRYSKTEIRIFSTVPVAEIQKDADALAKELRELNDKIQELNWTSEI